MVTELLVVWIVGVVAFFALWAILTKVIKHISEKRAERRDSSDVANSGKQIHTTD